MTIRTCSPSRWCTALLVLFAAAASSIGTGPGFAAEKLETPDIELLAVQDPNIGGQAAVAENLGLFKEEGLNVTVHWTQSTGDVITILASRTQNLATGGSQTAVILAAQGFPIKMIAVQGDSADSQGLALKPGLTLSDPRELEGKTLAFTEGTAPILILAGLAKQFGFDMKKVKIANMNPSEGVVATARGDIDGLLGFEPNLYRLVQLGGTMYASGTTLYIHGKPEKLTGDQRLYLSSSGVLASQAWIASKPNTLKAFLRAFKRATDIINNDRPKALAAMNVRFKVGIDVLDASTKSNKYSMVVSDDSAAAVRFTSDFAFNSHRIARGVTAEEVLDTSLLREVDPSLVTWTPGTH